MEVSDECPICYTNQPTKKLPCKHELCSDCCIHLNSALCPLCRQKFTFNSEEMMQRIKLGLINGYKWEVPPVANGGNASILGLPNRQLNYSLMNDNEEIIFNEPFSRVLRNAIRNRRRCFSLDEVLERRKEINSKISKINTKLDLV